MAFVVPSPGVDLSPIKIDVSGVGSAFIEVPADDEILSADVSSIVETVSQRILRTLPINGFAVSVVIPLYNEGAIVESLIEELVREFSSFPFNTEFLLCENGSKDETRAIAARMAREYLHVRLVTLDEPSYGQALKAGIEQAHADFVVIFNADLWSKRFFVDAVLLMQAGHDIVVGSKCLIPSNDKRPLLRRAITRTFNTFLRCVFGFHGSDTHGMKALRRSTVLQPMMECVTSKEIFDTELILRAQRARLKICEIPTTVEDSRPARLSLLRRVPPTLRDLFLIWRTL